MNLLQAEHNKWYVVKTINIDNTKTKIRLMELGLVCGVKIQVKRKSLFRKTLLIVFACSCFTLKDNLANLIEVECE